MGDPIFEIARRVLLRPEAQREVYLDGACGGDELLRERVRAAMAQLTEAQTTTASGPIATGISDGARTGRATGGGSPSQGATSGAAMSLDGPGAMIGQYKILQLIGEGGFGHVYMAQQSHPVRRKVAIKIVKPGMDSKQVLGRFESERQALAMMDHPNIARIYDAGITPPAMGSRPYFAMELVKGVPITEYCDTAMLTTRERLELFIDVCHAVQHAHHKGIIHRDLKPSNVLVTLHDDKPVVKVIDFGISKAMNQELTDGSVFTEFKGIIGTPQYMSPEQAALSMLDVDSRTDVYSLGVLLYELVAGATPFDAERLRGAGLVEMQRILKEDEPPRPSTRVTRNVGRAGTKGAGPATPTSKTTSVEQIARQRHTDVKSLRRLLAGDLDWICMKAMEKDRRRRYETAAAMGEDIRRHLAFEPILARPPSTVYRLQKFVRRNRGAVSAIVGVVCALVLTLTALGYGLLEVSHERDKTAERETVTRAEMLLSSMNAVRKYTADNVRPALAAAGSDTGIATTPDYNAHFVKEMVPGFSARQVFANFRDSSLGAGAPTGAGPYASFVYKEAALNPTNRANLADAFEGDLVRQFAANSKLPEVNGIRESANGSRIFYIARPMRIGDAKCLDCHRTPETAPPKQVEIYGKDGWEGGYGWQMDEVIAAQVVYVPVSEAFRAERGPGMQILAGAVGLCLLGGFVSFAFLLRRT